MKILINADWGGFSVSKAVYDELGIPWDGFGYIDNDDLEIDSDNDHAYRADARLIAAVEKLGLRESSRELSWLKIVEIPDGVAWYIGDYDGMETVRECHRSWS